MNLVVSPAIRTLTVEATDRYLVKVFVPVYYILLYPLRLPLCLTLQRSAMSEFDFVPLFMGDSYVFIPF